MTTKLKNKGCQYGSLFYFEDSTPLEGIIITTKVQLNDKQIELAKNWLKCGCEPYAYNGKLLWYWQLHYSGVAIKNALKLSTQQVEQLNQLS